MASSVSDWYVNARLGERCGLDTRCPSAEPSGGCHNCNTVDGRFMDVVNEYASTCDGQCAEQFSHDDLHMDPETQLGYCAACLLKMPPEVQARVAQYEAECMEGRGRFK